MGSANSLPRVGVSSCLLGEKVRYDGRDKLEPLLVDVIGPRVEWVAVCPELEVGMGVPREPVRLELPASGGADALGGGPRMLGTESRRDWTLVMRTFARVRLASLAGGWLSGYILKSRSPSCGLAVPLFATGGDSPLPGRTAAGLFAAELRRLLPSLPIVEEAALVSREACEEFLEHVRAYHTVAGAGAGRGPGVSGTRFELSD